MQLFYQTDRLVMRFLDICSTTHPSGSTVRRGDMREIDRTINAHDVVLYNIIKKHVAAGGKNFDPLRRLPLCVNYLYPFELDCRVVHCANTAILRLLFFFVC